MKLSTLFITLPLSLAAITLAVANRHAVTFSLDPFSTTDPALAYEVPLFVMLFAAVFLGMIFGGIAMWLSQSGLRARARANARDNRRLKREIERRDEAEAQNAAEPLKLAAE